MKSVETVTKVHPLISRIRVWLELGGKKNRNTGSVEVGEATTLGVRALLPGSIGVRVVDCSAMDGIGETSQKLLDERGCPIDVQVRYSLEGKVGPVDGQSNGYEHGYVTGDFLHWDILLFLLYTTNISCGIFTVRIPLLSLLYPGLLH